MRLDKYISHCTSYPRKDSRKAIKSGDVAVNGNEIVDPAFQVPSSAIVSLRQQTLSLPQPRYYMVYKPLGIVSASTDSENPCVTDLLGNDATGLQVAGRLDKDATGLLLLSDDGGWIHRVISPNKICPKTYQVEVEQTLTHDAEEQFRTGIALRNEKKLTRPAQLEKIDGLNYRVTISEGRYHQVKRMFAASGAHVTKLHREQIGEIKLDAGLKPGEYRELTDSEINSVYSQ